LAAIRRRLVALAGCTPGAAPHAKNRREHGTTPGEFGYEASTAKASRQSPIIVRSGTDSVNLFRQQIYKAFVSVALKPQKKEGLFFDCYYRACTTRELPPQLLALSEKLDQELLKKHARERMADELKELKEYDAHKTPHAPKHLILRWPGCSRVPRVSTDHGGGKRRVGKSLARFQSTEP